MIDTFKVRADIPGNKLLIQLRGYLMKSELELAFFVARKECQKLTKGYQVSLDLDGMHTPNNLHDSIFSRARRMFTTLGASNVKSIGALEQMQASQIMNLEYLAFDGVGFYPN